MFLQILSILLNILWWIIIVQAVMSWLIAFNVINTHNDFVGQLWHVLDRITEPLYRPFRRIMPDFGGIEQNFRRTDQSPRAIHEAKFS
ncbi:MAG: YggT family protein [Sphingopyxis sp.]|nr:YggT family protein [Sphingopyxis sp.]